MSLYQNTGVTTLTIDLTGNSGAQYTFCIHPANAGLPNEPGVYALTRLLSTHDRNEHYHVLFIGSTDDFSTLLKDKTPELANALNQATHIFTCTVTDKQQLGQITNDLIDFYGKGIPGLN